MKTCSVLTGILCYACSLFSGFKSVAQISFGLPVHAPENMVSRAEYFFGNDPGPGNGTPITVSNASTAQIQSPIPLAGLGNGVHKLSIRVKNANGSWSHTSQSYVNLYTLQATMPGVPDASVLSSAEYYIDTDPGPGNGIPVALNNSSNMAGLPLAVNISALSNGVHYIYIRAKDNNGCWSLTQNGRFAILVMNLASLPAVPVADSVRKIEYFFDQDPGAGHGIIITFPATQDLTNYNMAVNITALSDGNHTLFIRTLDRISMVQARSFYKGSTLPLHWIESSAQLINGEVKLGWQVVQDRNCEVYTITRSRDGTHFTDIASVPANPSEDGMATDYTATDEMPVPGRSYYRIRQQSGSGKLSYSAIMGIMNDTPETFFIINNPAHNDLIIRTDCTTGESGTYVITGMSGKVVLQTGAQPEPEQHISVAHLAPGTYILHYYGSGPAVSRKFVKQ